MACGSPAVRPRGEPGKTRTRAGRARGPGRRSRHRRWLASIPLTTSEYEEWGNPNDEIYYDYMLSYSPYDNVTAQDYPHLLVTTGLHDSQVQYWEPAKWVARLRAVGTGDNLLLLKTNMDAGHGGASGRLERYRESATEYTFLLMLAGLTSSPDVP